MAKVKAVRAPKSVYLCDACGHVEARWLGRCPGCQEWNSLIEQVDAIGAARSSAGGVAIGEGPRPITEAIEIGGQRLAPGVGELDRVLRGGLVAGSAVCSVGVSRRGEFHVPRPSAPRVVPAGGVPYSDPHNS